DRPPDRFGVGAVLRTCRHPTVHQAPGPEELRPVHPRRRPDGAPHQARHPHHGRRGDRRLGAARLLPHPRRDGDARCLDRAEHLGTAPAAGDGRDGRRRLPRRLHQDLQAAQPRAQRRREDRRAEFRRHPLRGAGPPVPGRAGPHAGLDGHLLPAGHLGGPRLRGHAGRGDPVRPVVEPDHDRRHQRGEPGRRARRARRGGLHPGLRRVHADGHLAVQPELRLPAGPRERLLRGARPPGPGPHRRIDGRRAGGLPLVEHLAGEDLHGRHRLPRDRRRDRRLRDPLPDPAPARGHGGPVRDDHPLGDHPGRLLQGDRRKARLQDGAAAAPLRAEGVAGGHGRGAVLDPRRPLRGRGTRYFLCGLGSGL
ncbi:MAG: Phospho-N-acetylmuramoyl-pentapeptide-transferase, partial [uncultured Arthrobacter sp.]